MRWPVRLGRVCRQLTSEARDVNSLAGNVGKVNLGIARLLEEVVQAVLGTWAISYRLRGTETGCPCRREWNGTHTAGTRALAARERCL